MHALGKKSHRSLKMEILYFQILRIRHIVIYVLSIYQSGNRADILVCICKKKIFLWKMSN